MFAVSSTEKPAGWRGVTQLSQFADGTLVTHTVDGRNPAPPGMYKTQYINIYK